MRLLLLPAMRSGEGGEVVLRHCEERSDEAIAAGLVAIASRSGLLRSARNDEFSRSRGAFFVRARVLCPTMLLTASPLALFPGFSLCPTQAAHKGEAERRETRRHNPRLAGTGRPLRGRSPLGVPLRLSPEGQLVPKALHQAMLRGTVRSARSCMDRPNRGRRTVRMLHGCYPRRKTNDCPRTVSTSRTGHDAGRLMPDAARERVTNPPAGTALAPSQGVSSRRTSLRKARWSLLVRRAGWIQEIPEARAICLI